MSIDPKNKPVKNGWMRFLSSPYSVVILTLIIGAFYVLTLQEGQDWSGDWSQYIHHAKNVAEGKHYLDTGYIFSGATRFVGPYAYPPVFPILLAPVYWFKGLDLEALKLVGIFCLCLTLMLIPEVLNYQLNRLQQIAIIVLTGLNPAFWGFRNGILSDFTFLLFCYLSLYLMLRIFRRDNDKADNAPRTIISSCLLGVAMYLAYGTREIGIVLPLTVLTYEIISIRRISLISTISISIFSVLMFVQHHSLQGNLTPPEVQSTLREFAASVGKSENVSHLDFINMDPRRIAGRIKGYRWAAQRFWPPDNDQVPGRLNSVIFNTTILLALIGFCLTLWRKITVLEIFAVGYIAVLLLFSAPPTLRYLFPLFPLMLYYCIVAYQRFLASSRFRKAGLVSYLFLTTISYGHAIYAHSYEELTNGVTHPKAVEMFDFIRNNTSQSDTILFRKPRIMALLTQRPSAAYARGLFPTADSINRFADAVGADYYVDFKFGNPLTHSEPRSSRFSEVFRNTHFAIYRYNQSVSAPDKLTGQK
jgi:hypothetical protein